MHMTTSPRRNYIVVHHAGYAGSENNSACTVCYNPPSYFYDFCIDRWGSVCDNGTWGQSCGGHAFQANCNTIGVMMQGCYGGCGSGDLCCLTDAQLCGLAWVSHHLQVPTPNLYNHISHRKASSWRPCACGSCGEGQCASDTVCCGTNLATLSTPHGWTNEGQYEMNRMLWMRSNLDRGCNCTGEICA